MRIIYSLILILVCSQIQAQAPQKFYARYGGNGYDVGYDVKQTLDKGYIITGSTSSWGAGNTDVYLLKLDSMGHVKFQNTFGNANNDIGKEVLQLPDSSYVIVGYTSSFGFGGYDVFLVKADKYGQLEWQKTIGGTDWDFAHSIQQTTDGGYIIGGSTYSYGYGNEDGYVVKIDATGNVMWSKTFGGPEDDSFKSVIQTTDGGIALCGTTKSYGDANGDAWVFKLNSNGDSAWSKRYGGVKEDFVNKVIQISTSEILTVGGTLSYATLQQNWYTKFDLTTGNINADYPDPGSKPEYYNSCAVGLNGNFVGCGKSTHNVFGDQALIEIYTGNFSYLNFFPIAMGYTDELFSVCKTKDRGFVFVGATQGNSSSLQDVFFVKTDSVGNYGNNITGITDVFSKESVKINAYPNPTSDELCIIVSNKNNNDIITFKLFNIEGIELLKGKIKTNTVNKISVSEFNNGLYYIELNLLENSIITEKISIVK